MKAGGALDSLLERPLSSWDACCCYGCVGVTMKNLWKLAGCCFLRAFTREATASFARGLVAWSAAGMLLGAMAPWWRRVANLWGQLLLLLKLMA